MQQNEQIQGATNTQKQAHILTKIIVWRIKRLTQQILLVYFSKNRDLNE